MCIPSGAQTHESFRSPRALKTPETGHSRSPLTHLGASGAEGRVQTRRRRRAHQQPLQWHGPALSPLEKHSRSSPRRSFCLPTPSARAGSSQSARGTASPWRARGKRERVFPRGDSQCTGSDPSRRVFFFFLPVVCVGAKSVQWLSSVMGENMSAAVRAGTRLASRCHMVERSGRRYCTFTFLILALTWCSHICFLSKAVSVTVCPPPPSLPPYRH